MKKFFSLSLAAISLLVASNSFAAANDWRFMRRDSSNILNINFDVPTPASSSLMVLDINGSTAQPLFIGFGSGLVYDQVNGLVKVSGVDYNSLSNLPTIPAGQIAADWNQTNVSAVDYIKNKPSIPAAYTDANAKDAALGVVTGNNGVAYAYNSTTKTATIAPTYGATANTITQGNDSRLSDSRAPGGSAGGVLVGSYPSPSGLAASGVTAGTYADATVTVGADGRVTSISAGAKAFANPTITLNSAAQLSTTRDVLVVYPVDVNVQSLLLGSASGTTTLEYADNAGMTTNVVAFTPCTNSTSGVLSLVNTNTCVLSGVIPAGKYREVITTVNSGTVNFTAKKGQETSL